MEKFEMIGLKEITDSKQHHIEGGSWIGEMIGKVVGTALRYGGPNGAITLRTDMVVYFATN